jgi:hypothetical protein
MLSCCFFLQELVAPGLLNKSAWCRLKIREIIYSTSQCFLVAVEINIFLAKNFSNSIDTLTRKTLPWALPLQQKYLNEISLKPIFKLKTKLYLYLTLIFIQTFTVLLCFYLYHLINYLISTQWWASLHDVITALQIGRYQLCLKR